MNYSGPTAEPSDSASIAPPDEVAPLRPIYSREPATEVRATAAEEAGRFSATHDYDGADGAVQAAAVGGVVWTVLGFGTMQVLRFGFNLVLTRLIAQDLLGVMVIVNLCVQALHMFSDLGIRQCVVHHARGDDPRFLNTAWTIQIVRGVVLWICAAALAWPAAAFYDDMPELVWLVPLAGITALFDGFQSTALLTLSRRLIRGRLVLLEVLSYTIWTSLIVLGVWLVGRAGGDPGEVRNRQLLTLAAGTVLTSLTELVASYLMLRGHRHRFEWDAPAVRELIHFGGWIFLSTACTFLASQADRLVIGKISAADLGVYNVAAQIARIPTLLMYALAHQLAFPLYSRLFQSGRDAGRAVTNVHLLLAGGAAAMATGLLCAGPTFVHVLYRPAFHDAARYLPLLAVAAWFTMLQSTGEAVLLATGQTRRIATAQVVKLVALLPLLYLGYRWGGLVGLVIGFAAAEVLRYLVLTDLVRRLGLPQWRDDFALTGLAVMAFLLDWGIGAVSWDHWPLWLRLLAETGTLVWFWAAAFGAYWLLGRIDLGLLTRRTPAGAPHGPGARE